MGVPERSKGSFGTVTMKKRRIILDRSPLAFTSQGKVIIGVHVMVDRDFDGIIETVREMGGRVFIGVAVEGRLRDEMLKDIDDLSWDSAARFGADLRRSKRART